jgi:hypothetical protein
MLEDFNEIPASRVGSQLYVFLEVIPKKYP